MGRPRVSGLAPIWISGPLAMVTLVIVAAHLLAMRGADMPESRRRIRTANGWLILITAPVLAIAFSVVSPANPRRFALVWAVAILLLGLVILMAFVDMANNLRLARHQRRQLGRSMGHSLRQHLAAQRKDDDGP
ncbi:MAG: hypothetical protein RIE32_10465 [Phycisphaerales bacterium]